MKSLIKLAALAALSCGILAQSYAGGFSASLSAPGSLSGNLTVPSTANVIESCGTANPNAVTVSGPLGFFDEGPQLGFQSQYHTGNVPAGTYGYAVTEFGGGYTVIVFTW